MPALAITTIIGCKNACSYCPQKTIIKAYKGERLLSLNVFKKCLDKLPRHVYVHFAGLSEPWLNPDCSEMVALANKEGHKIRIYTTLVGMVPKDIDILETIPIEDFVVHLPSAERYENIIIDQNYFDVLHRLNKSKISPEYVYLGSKVAPELSTIVKKLSRVNPCTRAGNINGRIPRKKGLINCKRMDYNILLPNGDVLLCCMDYGIKHIIGNLLSEDTSYESLFKSEEFLKVKRGFKDESIDIICRYCDNEFAFNEDSLVFKIKSVLKKAANYLHIK